MNHEKLIEIYYDKNKICEIDAENPNLSDFVMNIVNSNIEKSKLDTVECKTDIKGFDINSFTEMIKLTIVDIKDDLLTEMSRYEEIKKTIILDMDVYEYFNVLLLAQKDEMDLK